MSEQSSLGEAKIGPRSGSAGHVVVGVDFEGGFLPSWL